MKIAWIHTFPENPPSSGVFMRILADGLCRQGLDLEMIGAVKECRSWRVLLPPAKLRKATAQHDLVHAQYGSGCAMLCSRLPGPKIVTLRGSDWYGWDSPTLMGCLHRVFSRMLTRMCLRRFGLVITMSERMRESVQHDFPGIRCETLPDGVDLTHFRPMDRAEARRLLGAADDSSPWVLFSSVLEHNPLKRKWLAQAAVEELQKTMPEVKLKTLTGLSHSEVPVFINACDVLLLASTHEGWPNIVKESLACNVPFVSTDVSDLPDIAQVEPTCHVTEANPQALASRLTDVLSQPRPANLRKHVEYMDLPVVVERLVRLYREVLDDSRKR